MKITKTARNSARAVLLFILSALFRGEADSQKEGRKENRRNERRKGTALVLLAVHHRSVQ